LASTWKQTSVIFRLCCPETQRSRLLSDTKKLKSTSGFTIMEVAMAATVLALTLVGMIQVVDSGSEMLDLSRKQTIAAQILQDEINQLHLLTWTEVTSLTSATTNISADSTFTTFAAQMGGHFPFTGTRTVVVLEPAPPSANPTLLVQVTYTVTWKGVTGHTYTRTSTTYVGKNGLNVAYQRS
jgi:hypothetical protein